MNHSCPEIAEDAEKKLEKLYISVTVEALVLSAAAIVVLLVYHRTFTAFIVMQVIGCILIILVVSSIILLVRKKRIKKEVLQQLKDNGHSEEAFVAQLTENPIEFELVRPLFIDNPKHS